MKANRSFVTVVLAVILFATASGVHAATQGTLALKQIAEGFTSPVVLVPYDETSGRMLVADQLGTIHVLAKDGAKSDRLFFDVRDRLCELTKGFDERGLLGLALHPRFADNRRLFLVYSAPRRSGVETNWNHTMTLSEFKVLESDRLKVDPASERVVLQID